MAGLTRTQKYAQLRAQLANDSESSGVTEDLNRFNEKLENFQETFDKKLDDTFIKTLERIEDKVDDIPTFKDIADEFKQTEEGLEAQVHDFLSDLDPVNLEKTIQDIMKKEGPAEELPEERPAEEIDIKVEETPVAPVEETPADMTFIAVEPLVEEEEVKEEVPAEPEIEERVEIEEPAVIETIEEPVFVENVEEPVVEEPAVEEVKVETAEEAAPVLNEFSNDIADIEARMRQTVEEISYEKPVEELVANVREETVEEPVHEEVKEEIIEEAPVTEEPVAEEVKEAVEEKEDILDTIIYDQNDLKETEEETVPEVNTEYVNDTLKEVEDYNRSEGYKTIDEIPGTLVDAVRHPEEAIKEMSDDEFSNTVTLEINKVLDEIKQESEAEEVKEEVVPEPEPQSEPAPEPVIEEIYPAAH